MTWNWIYYNEIMNRIESIFELSSSQKYRLIFIKKVKISLIFIFLVNFQISLLTHIIWLLDIAITLLPDKFKIIGSLYYSNKDFGSLQKIRRKVHVSSSTCLLKSPSIIILHLICSLSTYELSEFIWTWKSALPYR